MATKLFQHALALAFAIKEINENPKLLPNVTLGFHVYDSYYSVRRTYRSILDLLFKSRRLAANYRCASQKNLIAVIGGLGSDISFRMADVLGLYKIPQLTYGSFAPEERDTTKFPCFFRMVSNETHQNRGIIQLLLHFRWIWVGLIVVDDESGDHFLQVLELLFPQNGICSAFTQRIPSQPFWVPEYSATKSGSKVHPRLLNSKASTFLVYGETMTFMWMSTRLVLLVPENEITSFGKVWVITAQIDLALSGLQRGLAFQLYHGTIAFKIHSKQPAGFQTFLQNTKPFGSQGNGFLKDFWEQVFDCTFPNSQEPGKDSGTCTGEEKLESLPGPFFEMSMSGHSYSIYNAVYTVAHALHSMYSSRSNHRAMERGENMELRDLQPWQFRRFLKCISFNNSVGETVSFDDNMEMGMGFDIINVITFPNASFFNVKVGRVNPSAVNGKPFFINEHLIEWHRSFNQMLPVSLCVNRCPPGYRKEKKAREKFCCYDCVPCPEQKITNQEDMEDCVTCPDDQYPSKTQDGCIPRIISFLSYQEPLGISLACVAVYFSLTTALVLTIFIKY